MIPTSFDDMNQKILTKKVNSKISVDSNCMFTGYVWLCALPLLDICLNLCENCFYLTLKRFLWNSFREMCFLEESYTNRCKKKNQILKLLRVLLTGGNWQKWKRVFLTCLFHKIYRDEAVGLKSCKYTWKNTKFVKMGNLGQYCENLIFCQ